MNDVCLLTHMSMGAFVLDRYTCPNKFAGKHCCLTRLHWGLAKTKEQRVPSICTVSVCRPVDLQRVIADIAAEPLDRHLYIVIHNIEGTGMKKCITGHEG